MEIDAELNWFADVEPPFVCPTCTVVVAALAVGVASRAWTTPNTNATSASAAATLTGAQLVAFRFIVRPPWLPRRAPHTRHS
jgi:hypothetical protein